MRLCAAAVNACSDEDPASSALFAPTLFRHALAADEVELSCSALRHIPDTPHRLNSLRLLAIRLCESSHFDVLADLPSLLGPLVHQVHYCRS